MYLGEMYAISLPQQLGVEVVSVLLLYIFLELSCLGLAPNSVSGASPAQLPYAARAASSAVRLRLSLRTSLLAGIVRFGALSNTGAIIELLLREGTDTEATSSNFSLHILKPVSLGSIASKYLISFIPLS